MSQKLLRARGWCGGENKLEFLRSSAAGPAFGGRYLNTVVLVKGTSASEGRAFPQTLARRRKSSLKDIDTETSGSMLSPSTSDSGSGSCYLHIKWSVKYKWYEVLHSLQEAWLSFLRGHCKAKKYRSPCYPTNIKLL